MTYDTDKVDALLKAVDECSGEYCSCHDLFKAVEAAREALKPQPEMEYVLSENMPGGCSGEVWQVIDRFYGQAARHEGYNSKVIWKALREATRRPKQDKVPPGKDWDGSEIERLFEMHLHGRHYDQGLRDIIDAIKSKCGV